MTTMLAKSDKRERYATILAPMVSNWSELSEVERSEIIDDFVEYVGRPRRPSVGMEDGLLGPKEGEGEFLYGLSLCKIFATQSDDFATYQLRIIGTYFAKSGGVKPVPVNSVLAYIAGCAPENEMQAALAVQMALTHEAAMAALMASAACTMLDQYKIYGEITNKLLRTHAVLAETLNKMQRGGTQTVKHIHVNQGGQAIVTDTFNHSTEEGGKTKSAEQPHATGSARGGPALPCADALGIGVPISSREGEGEVQNARRH